MTSLVILLGLISLSSAYIADMNLRFDEEGEDPRHTLLLRDEKGAIKIMNLKDTRLEKTATEKDIIYYLYTRRNRQNPIVITFNDVNVLETSDYFSPEKQILFVIHGWENDHTSPVNTLITSAVLDTFDINVFVVDWSQLAKRNYFTAKFSVKNIGAFIGEFINNIAFTYEKSYKDIVIVGHSLGAHVAGAAGAAANEKVDHIVGLDPAQPLFSLSNLAERLDPTDADFVQIIHTSGGRLGFFHALGHADYYPNGGTSQPGCFLDFIGSCAHSRSYEYYADSIRDSERKFYAFRCKDYGEYKSKKCLENDNLSIMGRLEVDRNASGKYFLKTQSKQPFAENLLM